jgi:hypothetical protein
MPDSLTPIDLTKVQECNLREVLRLTEAYLNGTAAFAVAADARATNLSTMTATLMTGTAAVGAAVIALPKENHTQFTFVVAVAALAASVCFAVALLKAVSAAKPQPFDVAGNYPDCFTAADLYGDPKALLLEQVRIYQKQINNNNARLHESAAAIEASLSLLRWAPIVAVLAGVIAYAVRYPWG